MIHCVALVHAAHTCTWLWVVHNFALLSILSEVPSRFLKNYEIFTV